MRVRVITRLSATDLPLGSVTASRTCLSLVSSIPHISLMSYPAILLDRAAPFRRFP